MTQPAIPVSEYANGLFDVVANQVVLLFPYAAAITAFAISVGMVKRWIGHRSATSMGESLQDHHTRRMSERTMTRGEWRAYSRGRRIGMYD